MSNGLILAIDQGTTNTKALALDADGGAARNDMLMQFQADIIERPVVRSELSEVSAAGAAMLAASGLGRNSARLAKGQSEFVPSMSAERRTELTSAWLAAVGKVLEADRRAG